MKNQFYHLTLALFTVTLATAETSSVSGVKTTAAIAASVKADQYQTALAADAHTSHRTYSPVEDKAVLNPENVLTLRSEGSIEETIAEDNKITESTLVYDGSIVFIEKPIEEIIAEDKKIIESNISLEIRPLFLERPIEDVIDENNDIIDNPQMEVRPLDFKAIDKCKTVKIDNKVLIGMN